MESFTELHVSNKDNFRDILYKKNMEKLREKIYFFMLNNQSENDFFDMDEFNRKYVKDMNKTSEMINKVVIELNNLGWKTQICFGGTGLYIYSSEELPSGVW